MKVPDRVLTKYFEQKGNAATSPNYVVWDPPFEDANDRIIKALCDRRTIEPVEGIPAEERMARFKKYRWSDPLVSSTHSNAYEVVHPIS